MIRLLSACKKLYEFRYTINAESFNLTIVYLLYAYHSDRICKLLVFAPFDKRVKWSKWTFAFASWVFVYITLLEIDLNVLIIAIYFLNLIYSKHRK